MFYPLSNKQMLSVVGSSCSDSVSPSVIGNRTWRSITKNVNINVITKSEQLITLLLSNFASWTDSVNGKQWDNKGKIKKIALSAIKYFPCYQVL
jgi:hypothetical protein